MKKFEVIEEALVRWEGDYKSNTLEMVDSQLKDVSATLLLHIFDGLMVNTWHKPLYTFLLSFILADRYNRTGWWSTV